MESGCRAILPWVILMCLQKQIAVKSEIESDLEEIAKCFLTIFSGNVSRMFNFVFIFYLCVDMQYDLSKTSFIF